MAQKRKRRKVTEVVIVMEGIDEGFPGQLKSYLAEHGLLHYLVGDNGARLVRLEVPIEEHETLCARFVEDLSGLYVGNIHFLPGTRAEQRFNGMNFQKEVAARATPPGLH